MHDDMLFLRPQGVDDDFQYGPMGAWAHEAKGGLFFVFSTHGRTFYGLQFWDLQGPMEFVLHNMSRFSMTYALFLLQDMISPRGP